MLFGRETMGVKEVLSKRLKWLREQNRLAQKEIAAEIGITLNGYQKIEYADREPKLDMLVKLCDFYNVNSDFLLGRNNLTKDLQKLIQKIATIKEQTEDLNDKNFKLVFEISTLREKMIELAREEGFNSKSTVEVSVNLDMAVDKHRRWTIQIEELNAQLKELMYEYIKKSLEIPDSEMHNDEYLEEFLPIEANIQIDLFEEYSLHVFCNEIGYIGTIGLFKSEEEARIALEEFLKRVNGVKH
jgi:transcriptional regulator with XRE-family HTH domain